MGQRQGHPCVRLASRCIGSLWRKGDRRNGRTRARLPRYPFRQRRSNGELSSRCVGQEEACRWHHIPRTGPEVDGRGCCCSVLDPGGLWWQRAGQGKRPGSHEPSGGSTSGTTVAQNGSTPKQGTGAAGEVAAAAKRAMQKYHLKAVLVKVTEGTEEVETLAMGEST